MAHPLSFYVKVSIACFSLGAAMEAFMINTGFYDKVVEIEAQRLEETKEDREAFRESFKLELERQAAQRNVNLALPKEDP